MAAVPPAQSVFPATFPMLCVLPLLAGTGTLKPLLNLPEVFGCDGLFMLHSEAPGTSSGLPATQSTVSATHFYQIPAVDVQYAAIEQIFPTLF